MKQSLYYAVIPFHKEFLESSDITLSTEPELIRWFGELKLHIYDIALHLCSKIRISQFLVPKKQLEHEKFKIPHQTSKLQNGSFACEKLR